MKQYVALLRGINISGKNKIGMADLKRAFEAAGFSQVSTYLNSGNVVFSADNVDVRRVIEDLIADKFGLVIPVYVIAMEGLQAIVANAPAWWDAGDNEKYNNLIFILSGDTADEVCDLLGAPSDGLEQVQSYGNVIFWTFDRKAYRNCNWWKKTASAGIAEKLTIRTANTLKKLV